MGKIIDVQVFGKLLSTEEMKKMTSCGGKEAKGDIINDNTPYTLIGSHIREVNIVAATSEYGGSGFLKIVPADGIFHRHFEFKSFSNVSKYENYMFCSKVLLRFCSHEPY